MENNNQLITGPLGTKSVFDFSGYIADAPKVTNVGILQKKLRGLGEDKGMDDTTEFAGKANAILKEFENQTQEQLGFIQDDNDFSLNQISGYQGKLARLRDREAKTLNDVFNSSLMLVQSREQKRLIKEERKYQEKLLKKSQKWELKNKAMALGLSTKGSRSSLMKRISSYIAQNRIGSGSGSGVGAGGGIIQIDPGAFFDQNQSFYGNGDTGFSSSNPYLNTDPRFPIITGGGNGVDNGGSGLSYYGL